MYGYYWIFLAFLSDSNDLLSTHIEAIEVESWTLLIEIFIAAVGFVIIGL